MADLQTPSAVAISTIDAGSDKVASAPAQPQAQKSRPEKPDEQLYKEKLAKAEKEHADAKAKLVSSVLIMCASIQCLCAVLKIPGCYQSQNRYSPTS